MTTIYREMEPKPEIYFTNYAHDPAGSWGAFVKIIQDHPGFYYPPYKPGDEIEYQDREAVHMGLNIYHKRGTVKSIRHVQHDGVWVWEIECGE